MTGKREEYIRRKNSDKDSVDDQVKLASWMDDEGISVKGRKMKMSELEEQVRKEIELEYKVETSVGNLYDIGIVGRNKPSGPDNYAISERLDEVINGDVDSVTNQEVEALISHVQEDDPDESASAVADGGSTVRKVVASALGVAPDGVEAHLRRGDQVRKLNDAVDAIEHSSSVAKRDDYGRITFRNAAYRYFLTRLALEL